MEKKEITYVATEPDLTIAEVTPTVTFNLARLTKPGWSSCGSWGSFVSTTVDFDESAFADEDLVIYEVIARNDDAGLQGTDRNRSTGFASGSHVVFGPDIVGEAFPPEGWCVDLKLMDAAGNVGAHVTSCEVSGCYEGEPTSSLGGTPFEPGPCDPGDDTSTDGLMDSTSTGASADTAEAPSDDAAESNGSTGTPAASSDDELGADRNVASRGCACAMTRRNLPAASRLVLLTALARRRRRR